MHVEGRMHVRVLAARGARGLRHFPPSSGERAQGKPGADCTRGPRATKSTGVGPQVQPETSRLSLRDGFTVSFALSPVTGLLPPSSLRSLLLTNLAPAPGRQDHTTSPSATALRSSSQAP